MLRSRISSRFQGLLVTPVAVGGTRVVARNKPEPHSKLRPQLCLCDNINRIRSITVRAAAVAVAPAPPSAVGIQRGDTTGATMVVDDVWVQVSG